VQIHARISSQWLSPMLRRFAPRFNRQGPSGRLRTERLRLLEYQTRRLSATHEAAKLAFAAHHFRHRQDSNGGRINRIERSPRSAQLQDAAIVSRMAIANLPADIVQTVRSLFGLKKQHRKKRWIKLFPIKDSLTLDRVQKLDSNQNAIREHVACRLSEGRDNSGGS
jgi:hypothetical protein